MAKKKTWKDQMLSWDLNRLARQFFAVGLAFALVASYLGYTRLYLNEERRFWMAINNAMSLPSVTRVIENGGTGNQIVQTQQFHFSPQRVALSHVAFTQRTATESTNVQTEGISYTDAQYSRYTQFSTNQQAPDGSSIDLDEVLGLWEGNVAEGASADQSRLAYVSELVTLVIFGNFDSEYRSEVIEQMQDQGVYDVAFAAAVEEEINGEDVVRYPMSVKIKPFVQLLNDSFIRAGLGDFPPLDPASYSDDAPPAQAQITISKNRNVITEISFGGREEKYSAHGVVKSVEAPEVTFGPGELEQRVQEELQGVL